ncbi:class I SAM-dependent methyltransferase [Opitutales bacterium]|nr:class I SAM-dependent methyltransferase [Opitutales bacterium]
MICPSCRSHDIQTLPKVLDKSLRSDGATANTPLRKWHCFCCGLGFGENVIPDSPYRRSDGQSIWQKQRHDKITLFLQEYLNRLPLPQNCRFLEIGGANFLTSINIAKAFPNWKVCSIEPNPECEPIEKPNNFSFEQVSVFEYVPQKKFDLIFSHNVIEHLKDTRGFLNIQSNLLSDDGVIVISCPDSGIVSEELLFDDHLYHFTKESVEKICSEIGLIVAQSIPSKLDENTIVFFLKKNSRNAKQRINKKTAYNKLYERRKNYFISWKNEDLKISNYFSGTTPLIFGTGEFAQLALAYFPRGLANASEICTSNLEGARVFPGFAVRLIGNSDRLSNKIFLAANPKTKFHALDYLLGRGFFEGSIYIPFLTKQNSA